MRVIVTGAAGFIGSRFCEHLLENVKDIYIIGVDDLSGGFLENLPQHDNFKFIKADLKNQDDQKLVEQEFKNGQIDYIWHMACFAAECLSPFIRQFNYQNSVLASVFLITCAIKYNIKRFIFTSSMSVYGNQQAPFDENLTPKPIDPYAISKYCVEMDLAAAWEQHHLEYCIIRPHNVYGVNQNIFDPYRNVLGIWMYQALNDLPFTIYGDGTQTRAFSFVDDVLPCLWEAAVRDKAKNEIINVGGIKDIALNEAADILYKVTQTPHTPIYLEKRHEVKHAWSTFQKSVDLLDYTETVTLEKGLQVMWDWVKTQPMRERKYFTEYELDKGIYSYWKKK